MPRVVILGTGTEVGKTYVTRLLARRLTTLHGVAAVALKPIETGLATLETSDFAALATSARAPLATRPIHAFRRAVSPHLAARDEGATIDPGAVVRWVRAEEAHLAASSEADVGVSLVETAGAAFSPLGAGVTNHDLARALEPAAWVLVAPDRLGVLHDLAVTLRALARPPDAVVLSTPLVDTSTGTNAAELRALGIADPAAVVPHGGGEGVPLDELDALTRRLLAR